MGRPANGSSTSVDPTSGFEASFSDCGGYRWWLKRRWADGQRSLMFIGLNPSTADASRNDPTLRRLIGFAQRWGFAELVVLNLFARISPHPAVLRTVQDPIGEDNDAVLAAGFEHWSGDGSIDLWLGWGAKGALFQRSRSARQILAPFCRQRLLRFPAACGPLMLGLTRNAQPRHPLYAPRNGVLIPLVWAEACVIRHPEARPPVFGSY